MSHMPPFPYWVSPSFPLSRRPDDRPFCPLTGSIRTATKRAGGSVRNHGGSPGKRLGVKKFSGVWYSLPSAQHVRAFSRLDQYVIPGNIIVRQRGTQFHPGQHVRLASSYYLTCEF